MLLLSEFWFVFLVSFHLPEANAGIKVQTCEATSEPYQITYTKRCTKACVQECGATPAITENCQRISKKCSGLPATCGDSGCECTPSVELSGNLNSKNTISVNMIEKIVCKSKAVEVYVSKCALNEIGFKLGDLYVDGPSLPAQAIMPIDEVILDSDEHNTCLGSMSITESGIHYLFKINETLAACKGNVTVGEGHRNITYANAIKGVIGKADSVISRRHAIDLSFSCTFPVVLNFTANLGLQTSNHRVDIYSGKTSGEFNVELDLWKDTWYGTHYVTGDEFLTENYIYVSVDAVVADSDRLKLQILQAIATPSNNINDVISYALIMDGCPNNDDPDPDGIKVKQNGRNLVAKFKFKAFQFLTSSSESQQIYLHVMAHLCDEIFEGDCDLSCRNRSKREVNSLERKHNTKVTSSPPIIVSSRRRKHDNTTSLSITVMEALDYIKESWEMTLLIVCILLLIIALMISMCVLLVKLRRAIATTAPLKADEIQ
ncbi:unnamed protein product [Clavelina lepadiformis]|uniref:ZP domain-containing protein n=1 Tax=Clavelina lepadiformis TaxID=159417 RepID=A0ABP0H338_CLALP